jgi:hypothetical protein
MATVDRHCLGRVSHVFRKLDQLPPLLWGNPFHFP